MIHRHFAAAGAPLFVLVAPSLALAQASPAPIAPPPPTIVNPPLEPPIVNPPVVGPPPFEPGVVREPRLPRPVQPLRPQERLGWLPVTRVLLKRGGAYTSRARVVWGPNDLPPPLRHVPIDWRKHMAIVVPARDARHPVGIRLRAFRARGRARGHTTVIEYRITPFRLMRPGRATRATAVFTLPRLKRDKLVVQPYSELTSVKIAIDGKTQGDWDLRALAPKLRRAVKEYALRGSLRFAPQELVTTPANRDRPKLTVTLRWVGQHVNTISGPMDNDAIGRTHPFLPELVRTLLNTQARPTSGPARKGMIHRLGRD